jgi:hypothetical protein
MNSRELTIRKIQRKPVFVLHFILWVALVFEIGSFLISVARNPSYGIFFEPGKNVEVWRIRDFSFLFNFAQRAWLRETTVTSGSSIYSLRNHLKVTSDWAGTDVPGSLQFGYSPTMLWLLVPLVPFSNATAYLIFNIAGLFAIFWMTRPRWCRWGIGLLPFFSEVARYCFVLGQTAFATGAALLFVGEKTLHGDRQGWRHHLSGGTVLWALTAKPPIALSAAAVLIGLRRWRTLLIAALLTVISTLLLWPLMGAHWLTDYIHLLGTYNTKDAGPAFVMAVVPAIMTSLRAILSVDIGLRDDISSLISLIVWLSALGYIILAGLRFRLPAAALWAMSIFSYLLFCPHVTPTDEIQVVVILALCVSPKNRLTKHESFLLLILPLLPFMSPIPGPFAGMRLPFFLSQLALFFFFAFSGKKFASAGFAGESP